MHLNLNFKIFTWHYLLIWSCSIVFTKCRKPVKGSSLWGTWSGKLLDWHHMRRGSLSFLKLERISVLWKLPKESWALTRGQRRSVRKCLTHSVRWGNYQASKNFKFWVLLQPTITLLSIVFVTWYSWYSLGFGIFSHNLLFSFMEFCMQVWWRWRKEKVILLPQSQVEGFVIRVVFSLFNLFSETVLNF